MHNRTLTRKKSIDSLQNLPNPSQTQSNIQNNLSDSDTSTTIDYSASKRIKLPQSYQKTSNYVQIDNNILEKQLREQLIEHQRNKYRSRTSSPDKTSQSSPNMNKLTQNTTEKLLIDDIQIRLKYSFYLFAKIVTE